MVGDIPKADAPPPSPKSDLPSQIQTGISKAYPASKAPGIKKWFEKMFPNMSESDLDKAVGMWMQNEMKYMQSFMKKLDAQKKQAFEEMKRSIMGE